MGEKKQGGGNGVTTWPGWHLSVMMKIRFMKSAIHYPNLRLDAPGVTRLMFSGLEIVPYNDTTLAKNHGTGKVLVSPPPLPLLCSVTSHTAPVMKLTLNS